MRIKKYALISFSVFTLWGACSVATHYLARDIIRYIAFNITDSGAGCCKFHWDTELQITVYLIYALIFVTAIKVLIVLWKRFGESMLVSRSLLLVLIMSFPTQTFWGVETNCRGFGGCSNGVYLNIIVPAVMSTNPIAIVLSSIVAYQLAKYYVRLG